MALQVITRGDGAFGSVAIAGVDLPTGTVFGWGKVPTSVTQPAVPTASDLVATARPPLVSAASTGCVPEFTTPAMVARH
jgi:hypothetical protein